MANVRKVSCGKQHVRVTAQVDVPENLYEEPSEMNHLHSSRANLGVKRRDSSFRSDLITKSSSPQCTPNKMATPGDSIVSATSLIMTASPYLESKFLEGNRTLEDLYISNHEYPFENLVFEGGGSKGMAYVGALQVINNIRIMF